MGDVERQHADSSGLASQVATHYPIQPFIGRRSKLNEPGLSELNTLNPWP